MNKKLCMILLSGIMLFSMVSMMPAMVSAAAATDDVVVTRTVESYVCESAHPYTNNFDYTWTITKSGATSIKVYFEYIDVESNYDFVYVYDGAGAQLHKITGSSSGWSAVSNYNTIKIRLDTDYSVTKNGFKITQIDYVGGTTPPPVGDFVLEDGVTESGTLTTSTDTDVWTIAVDDNCESMYTVLTCGSADYDLYGRLGAAPTTSTYDWRGYTGGGEEVTFANPGAGTWYIMVNVYSGAGAGYTLNCDLTYNTPPPADTTAPTVSITSPSNGATVSGSVTVSVSATDNVGVVGKAISVDGGAYTTSLTVDTTALSNGEHSIRARAWDAAGNYGYSATILVEVDNYVPPVQDWVLTDAVTETGTLTSATDTDVWTIVVEADCESMYTVLTCGSADYDLYGRLGAAPTTSTYNWRGYTSGGEEVTFANPGAGTWYIMVNVYSGAGASYTLNCDLTYGTAPPPPTDDGGALTDGEAATGHMNQADGADMWYIDVDANAESMSVILTCGSADFDTYGRFGVEPTTSTYDWRGYTSGGEENTVSNPAQGRHYIMVDYYSGEADYVLTVTITYGGTPPPPPPVGGDKYALIVGISDYKAINDLSYCDEDATDWYNYLVNVMGYSSDNIIVLGDGHSSNFPKYNGYATEANYKYYLNWLADQDCDEIAFITSGHGAGDGNGESYLCAWDCGSGESGEDGNFYDHEVSAILQTAVADNIFVFIDHCYSGGMGPELMGMSNKAKVYCTTTCTEDGYGYDDPTHNNGAWTYYFLEYTLINHFGSATGTTMEQAFDYAAANYNHSGGDAPMEFDGNTGAYFYL